MIWIFGGLAVALAFWGGIELGEALERERRKQVDEEMKQREIEWRQQRQASWN